VTRESRLFLVTVYGSRFTGFRGSRFTVFLKLFHLFARRRVAGGGKVQQQFGLAPSAFDCAEPAHVPTENFNPSLFEKRN